MKLSWESESPNDIITLNVWGEDLPVKSFSLHFTNNDFLYGTIELPKTTQPITGIVPGLGCTIDEFDWTISLSIGDLIELEEVEISETKKVPLASRCICCSLEQDDYTVIHTFTARHIKQYI